MAFGFQKGPKNPPGHGGAWCHGCLRSFLCQWPRLCTHFSPASPTSQPLRTAGHSTLGAVWRGREIPGKSGLRDSFFSNKSLKYPHVQGLNSQQVNLPLKLFRRKLQVASRAVWVQVRDLSVQLCFTWLSGPSKLDRNPSGAGSLWDLPSLSCSAWKFLLWTFWEKLMSALILAGGAKPATHYLHSHKPKCSMPFNVSLGLEPVTFSILPPASAANSPLLFKRVQCYKSSIWLSAGPSHDLVLNKSGHEKY